MGRQRESKSERFIRVAEARVNRAIRALSQVGSCADIRIYEYSEAQVTQIFDALHRELSLAEDRFKANADRKRVFHLDTKENEEGERRAGEET